MQDGRARGFFAIGLFILTFGCHGGGFGGIGHAFGGIAKATVSVAKATVKVSEGAAKASVGIAKVSVKATAGVARTEPARVARDAIRVADHVQGHPVPSDVARQDGGFVESCAGDVVCAHVIEGRVHYVCAEGVAATTAGGAPITGYVCR